MAIPSGVLTQLNSLATSLEVSLQNSDRRLDTLVALYHAVQVLRGEVGGGGGGGGGSPIIPQWSYTDALSNSGIPFLDSAGTLYAWNIINPNTSKVYVKIYDDPSGGTSGDLLQILEIPASGSVVFQSPAAFQSFTTGLTIVCYSTLSGTGAPSSPIYASIGFLPA